MKFCSNKYCLFENISQPEENFSKRKVSKDGLKSQCKSCIEKYQKQYRNEHKEKINQYQKQYDQNNKEIKKIYYENNKECLNKHSKEYYKIHKEDIRQQKNRYYQENINRITNQHKEYQKIHREKINQRRKDYRQKDLQFRIACNLRTRLWESIECDYKSGSAINDMGCSVDEMFKMFESTFEISSLHPILGKMSRNNYGWIGNILGWEIDHIVPLSSFDLSNRKELLKAVHYSNLRPMWASQNRSDGARGLSRNNK